jgi:hypothetical protein
MTNALGIVALRKRRESNKSAKSTENSRRSATATTESSSETEWHQIGALAYIGVDDLRESPFAQNRLLHGVSPWYDQHCMVSPWTGIVRD